MALECFWGTGPSRDTWSRRGYTNNEYPHSMIRNIAVRPGLYSAYLYNYVLVCFAIQKYFVKLWFPYDVMYNGLSE